MEIYIVIELSNDNIWWFDCLEKVIKFLKNNYIKITDKNILENTLIDNIILENNKTKIQLYDKNNKIVFIEIFKKKVGYFKSYNYE